MGGGSERRGWGSRRRLALGLLALLAALSLGACGRLNRTSTLGSAGTGPTVAGTAVAAALAHELAAHGAAPGSVACAHEVLVHVGTTSVCGFRRAGQGGAEVVTFRFADKSGAVVAGSVSTR